MISDLIVQSKAGDTDATMTLINKFNPLLKKYEYKLFYEDAYNDLLVDFIELIHTIKLDHMRNRDEGSLISYISKTIYDSYIKRSMYLKKNHNLVFYSDLSDRKSEYVEAESATTDTYFTKELFDLNKVMTKSEIAITKMLYMQGYTVKEVASDLGITRQAVNQMKKRILKKLKNLYSDKLQGLEVKVWVNL